MKCSLYQRPDKPRYLDIKNRNGAPSRALPVMPEVLALDRSTECHVTPENAALTMMDALEVTRDQLVLEPQAGTGNLVQVLLDTGHSPFELTMVERSHDLCRFLSRRFASTQLAEPINSCFLEYAEKAVISIEFPRIVMNPPFRKTKQHVGAALDLLGRAGHSDAILVALVPITFEHQEAELIETLPNDTFVTAAVNTKIVRFVR